MKIVSSSATDRPIIGLREKRDIYAKHFQPRRLQLQNMEVTITHIVLYSELM